MKTIVLPATEPESIPQAVEVLRSGGLVAFPTDTVYGVGAMAFDASGVARLYEVKGRDQDKAIPVLISGADVLDQVAEGPPAISQKLAERFWPGPLTLVVWRHPALAREVSRGPTVGVRVPNHAVALGLLVAAGPLAVTSANRSGGRNPVTAQDVLDDLGGKVELLLDGGRTPGGVPSTVVDCTQAAPFLVREGPVSFDEISRFLKEQT